MALGKIKIHWLAIALLSSCASESCREAAKREQANKYRLGTVQVYKYDGSKQCNMGEKIELGKMAQELEGIPIVSMRNISDGKLRTQVCGAATGRANVYEISIDDLDSAKSRGFDVWPHKIKK